MLKFVFLLAAVSPSNDDLAVLRERIRADLLSGRSSRGASRHIAKQRDDGSWGDINYNAVPASGHPANAHVKRAAEIAVAACGGGRGQVRDARAARAIEKAWMYWMYSDKRLATLRGNKWWHSIGNPRDLAVSFLLAEGAIDNPKLKADVAAYVMNGFHDGAYYYGRRPATGHNLVWTAANRVYADVSLTRNDPRGVQHALDAIAGVVRVYDGVFFAKRGKISYDDRDHLEGIRPDMSFHQHGPQLYNGGYGLGFVCDNAVWVRRTAGLSVGYPREKVELLIDHVLDGTAWMVRRHYIDYAATGREVSRRGALNVARRGLPRAIESYAAATDYRARELAALGAHLRGAGDPARIGSKHFYRSDYHAHNRRGYHVSVRGASQRTYVNETLNKENLQGLYLSQGGMTISLDGTEYEDIFPIWNWSHVPGVTAKNVDPVPKPKYDKYVATPETFVGGVDDGRYGVMALSMNWGGLKAHKSWFMFDDEVVMVGTIAAGTHGAGIHTTFDQAYRRSPVHRSPQRRSASPGGLDWVWHNRIGYVFPSEDDVRVLEGKRTGSWRRINGNASGKTMARDVFTIYRDHGCDPVRGGTTNYTCIILPACTTGQAAAYAGRPRVQVLANTPDLQAVRHQRLKLTGAAFYKAGRLALDDRVAVRVDRPCIVLVDLSRAAPRVTACDPTQTQKELRVMLEGTARSGALRFALPQGGERGKSVTREWSRR